MLRARANWIRFSKRNRLLQSRSFCTNPPTTTTNNGNGDNKVKSNLSNYSEAYKQLDNLDFMTAAKILFTGPPKKKKFGIDFHLVQLFFACMPSLAVYLVAQYARYEMRRMEAELEQKKKQEEEERAKEMELHPTDEKDRELLKVIVRLDKLEETVKEIAVESKKLSGESMTKNLEEGPQSKHLGTADSSNIQSRSESNKSIDKDNVSKQKQNPGLAEGSASGSATVPNASWQDGQDRTYSGGPSTDTKR